MASAGIPIFQTHLISLPESLSVGEIVRSSGGSARAKSLQSEVARHFEQEIAEKEDACAEAIRLRINADRLIHLQRGEADIYTVDVVDQISSNQEWQQTPGNAKA